MFDHLRYRSTHVDARSPAGILAEKQLMLNDEPSVEYRGFVLRIIASSELRKRHIRETIETIDHLSASSPERAEELAMERASAESDLSKLDQDLTRIGGRARGN